MPEKEDPHLDPERVSEDGTPVDDDIQRIYDLIQFSGNRARRLTTNAAERCVRSQYGQPSPEEISTTRIKAKKSAAKK